MTEKKLSRNQRYELAKKEQGLTKVTVWCPEQCADELKELMTMITEFYLEKGEFHKDLFPAMYRDMNTGVMGNKSLTEVKRIAKNGK